MKGGQILLQGITLEEFFQRLQELQPTAPVQPTSTEDEFLSREEVCALLKISKTTLNTHTNKGDLKSYSIGGNRVLYKRSEVLAAVKPLEK